MPQGRDVANSQFLWKSYYAQQSLADRERDLSANSAHYRRDFGAPIQTNSFDYRQRYEGRGSPLRSNSPPRNGPSEYQRLPEPPINVTRYAPAFSHYEQHREQKEQREQVEHQKLQSEHQKQYEISQMSQGIRERIINTYRAEIESHKLSERNFATLRA